MLSKPDILVKPLVEVSHTFEMLCSTLRLLSGGLIAIEGFCSSGKTSLAEKLGHELSATVVHTDAYCTPIGDPLSYANCIDISNLAYVLQNLEPSKLAIVEGICLRDLMDQCGVNPKIYVYIKRIAGNGIWHDGFLFDKYQAEDYSDLSEPHASDLDYHVKKLPHEKADVVFFNKVP